MKKEFLPKEKFSQKKNLVEKRNFSLRKNLKVILKGKNLKMHLLDRWGLWCLLRLWLSACNHNGLIVLLTKHTFRMLRTLHICECNLLLKMEVSH